MKHHEISRAMPGLKYDVGTAVDEVEGMVDRLASTPAGHPEAGSLSQKIKSSLGRVRSAVDNVQPDQEEGGDFGGPQPNGGQVIGDGGNFANNAGQKDLAGGGMNGNVRDHEGRFAKLEDRMSSLEQKVETLHADLGGHDPDPQLAQIKREHEEGLNDPPPPPPPADNRFVKRSDAG